MTKTVIGAYANLASALDVAGRLADTGCPHEAISVVANDSGGELAATIEQERGSGPVARGTSAHNMSRVSIPGIGPAVASGPLATAVTGQGSEGHPEGLVGALIDMGLPADAASLYAESVRRGYALTTAQVDAASVQAALRSMKTPNLIPVERNTEAWREDSWRQVDARDRRGPVSSPTWQAVTDDITKID